MTSCERITPTWFLYNSFVEDNGGGQTVAVVAGAVRRLLFQIRRLPNTSFRSPSNSILSPLGFVFPNRYFHFR